jgi:hypothetical protein
MKLARNQTVDGVPSHLLVTADDRVLLAGLWKEAMICAWDMETGKELARMTDPYRKPASSDRDGQTQPAITGLALSADNRFLVAVTSWDDVSTISVWEVGSWKLIRSFAPVSPRNDVKVMVFSRDHRSLFVANIDSTILEWDVSDRLGRKIEVLNNDRLNTLWLALVETPNKAYPAAWELLDHPTVSVPFLIGKLSTIKPIDERHVRQLLGRLDAESFAEREEASRQLLALGEQTLPVLRRVLQDKPSLETRKRIEEIIQSLNRGPTPEQLRLLRAFAVLEWSGLPSAGEHLKRLANGDPSARVTRAAQSAWRRFVEISLGRSPSRTEK